MVSESSSTRSQLYWDSIIRIPSQIITLAISICVTRILDPKDFGVMGIVMMLVGYSNLITNFGFNEAIIQKGITNRLVLRSIFTFNLAVSCLLAMLFYFLSGIMAAYFQVPECEAVLKAMSLVFILSSFTSVPASLLRRDMKFKYIALLDFGSALSMNVLTLLFALAGFGYWALAYGQLIPLAVLAITLCGITGWVPIISYSHASMEGLFHFGVWNFMKAQLAFVSQHVDRFIIGKWMDPNSLGFYDKALSIAGMPYNSLVMNINSVMFSSFSGIKDKREDLQSKFGKSLVLLSLINCPIYLGLIAIAPHFVVVLLGEKWRAVTLPLQIMAGGMLVRSFGGLIASLNVGVGHYREHTVLALGALMCFVVSAVALLPFGIVGIAISYCVYSILQVYLWMDLSVRCVAITWKVVFLSIFPAFSASAVMFLVAESASQWVFIDHSFMDLVLLLIVSALTYLSCLAFNRSPILNEFKVLIWEDVKAKTLTRSRWSLKGGDEKDNSIA